MNRKITELTTPPIMLGGFHRRAEAALQLFDAVSKQEWRNDAQRNADCDIDQNILEGFEENGIAEGHFIVLPAHISGIIEI